MWHTSAGLRALAGAEARLIREAVDSMADTICMNVDQGELQEFGVSAFDRLEPAQQLAMLCDVVEALLSETREAPELTFLNEAAVAAIYQTLYHNVELEIESTEVSDSTAWRAIIRNASVETDAADGSPRDAECPVPELSSRDLNDWSLEVGILASRVLHDADWEMEDLFVDQPPDASRALKQLIAIDGDYFVAVPPDCDEDDVELLLKRLRAVLHAPENPLDNGGQTGSRD